MTTLNSTRLPRKTLATQLDRLDVILDGLADALNGSVEDAVRGVVAQAVREAVAATLQEILSQPELLKAALARHAPAQAQPAAPRRTLRDLLNNAGGAASGAVASAASRAGRAIGRAGQWLSRGLRVARHWLLASLENFARGALATGGLVAAAGGAAWSHRRLAAVALAAGLLSGAACYHAGPAIAGLACGLYGSALAVAGGAWSSTRPSA